MKERPILFSGPMVRAILNGRKTQTRRIVRFTPHALVPQSPYGKPGDRLWVRETWNTPPKYDSISPAKLPSGTPVRYAVDGVVKGVSKRFVDEDGCIAIGKGRPSIFMPRWASRITLEVTAVRVEPLHAITEDDALAEGVDPRFQGEHDEDPREVGYPANYNPDGYALDNFRRLWESINGKRAAWDSNPFVWVVEFKQLEAAAKAA